MYSTLSCSPGRTTRIACNPCPGSPKTTYWIHEERKGRMAMKRNTEKGPAMLFDIILVLVLSVMAASMMFLSKSETWASMNYRLMTQARYGAEAGIHATANYLMTNYAPPAPTAGNPPPMPAGYNITVPVPAKCGDIPCVTDNGGNPIFLSTLNGVPSTYPDGAQQAAFKAVTGPPNNTLQAGNTTVNYSASANLLSMVQITPFATTNPLIDPT